MPLSFARLLLAWLCRAAPLLCALLLACQPAAEPTAPAQADWLTGPFREPGHGREADLRRLRAALAAAPPPTGEYQFRLLRRLAIYLRFSAAPDSARPLLRQALRAGQPLARQVPIELAVVLNELGQDQWGRQGFDSARYYHLHAARLLRQAFPDSQRAVRVYVTDGRPARPAIMMAEEYCNAGLASQALGQLPKALRYYESGRRAYEWAADPAGLAWVHSLFAEALQAQRQQARAAEHFEQALALLRRQSRQQPGRTAQEWASILALYAPDLLTRQPVRLRQLAWEGQAMLSAPLAAQPTDRDLLASATKLTLLEARTYPSGAETVLDQSENLLRRFRQAAGSDFRTALGYYPAAAGLAELRAHQAWASGQKAAYARHRATALACRDSIAEPRTRARTTLALARRLVQWRDHALAVRELHRLTPVYRAAANQAELQAVYALLTKAYSGTGRLDSAFVTQSRAMALDDALRNQAQQATLAEAETRYRTGLQAARIHQLTQDTAQQRRQSRLAWLSVGLLLLLLGGSGYALLTTRRLNRRLDGQRRQIEEQASRLTVLGESKSQFFVNISHELRTPLTLVLGPVEQLLTDAELPAHARQGLLLIQRSGQRLQRLVNSILDLTKLEAGQLRLHPQPVAATALLRRLVEPFQTLAARRGITLCLQQELPDELTLLLDAEQVEQVLGNLLANALRHTPDAGRIEVRAAAAGPGQWQVQVQDSGSGVAPEERGRIFERFYQSQRHRVAGGTGIGLALSRELAQLMGGTLTVEGAPGEGATFVFRFRASVVSSAAPPLPTPEGSAWAEPPVSEELPALPQPDGARPRVLLVEDHADLRGYLRELLGPAYAVREAANGHEALARLAEEPADLIISDEMMPGMSGTELLRHLQQQPGWRAVPFLLVTARADLAHRLLALEVGVADYLGKPFVAAELLARVRNLLRNQAERRHYRAEDQPIEAQPAGTLPVRQAGAPTTVAEAPVLAASDAELLSRLRAVTEAALADEDFGPGRLAAAVGLSERTLYRRLKELTGLTPTAFVREVRLLQARHLLETRAVATVAEAAFAVGFANASHFGRVYTERFGRPPGEDKL